MRAVVVSQLRRRLLDGGTAMNQFAGVFLAVLFQPCYWSPAHVLDEVAFQGARGDAAMVSHSLNRPAGPLCHLQPVVDVIEF